MATVKQLFATGQALSVTGLDSLASVNYATSDEVDNTANLYLDVGIEVVIADIVEAGNFQVVVYAIDSLDGTNYSSGGPTSSPGTANVQPANMAFVGTVATPTGTTGPWRSRMFSLAAAFGGVVPPKWKLVLYNDTGVALAGSGNAVYYRGLHMQSV